MKELFKIGIDIGVGFLILGGVLIGIGSKVSNYTVKWTDFVNGTDVDTLTLEEDSIEPETISSFDLDVDFVNVTFEQGDEFKVDYGLYKEMNYDLRCKNGLLIVTNKHNLSLNIKGETKQYIKVTYPAETNFEICKIDADASKVTFDQFIVSELTLNDDAGSLEMNNTVCDKCIADMDASKITVNNSEIEAIDIDADASSVKVEKSTINNIDIDADAASVTMSLNGSEDDYDINVNSDASSCKINGKSITGDYKISGNGEKNIKIDADAAKVKIEFK